MNREKGLAYCGLACCICSENETCVGCRNAGCKNKEWCKHFICCKEKGLNGCWECGEFPCGGMHEKIRILAFAEFIKQHGEEKVMECLERNEKNGIVYHYPEQLVGDYDKYETVDKVSEILKGFEIKLRKYHSDDCEDVWKLFYNTIHSVNSTDYTEPQLDAWAPKDMDLHTWNQRLLRNDYAVVAELNDVIVGIGTADDIGYFDLLYIHKDYQRMGIATLIAGEIEAYLYKKDVQTISTDASITAKCFFEKRGYVVQKEQSVDCKGQFLINFKMQKMKYKIIHIVGASGSGTSTLGQALEQKYGYKWLDTDNYFWQPTDPPFTKSRSRKERVELLAADIEKHPRCVISGSLGVWGDVFILQFDLVVFIDTPADIRIKRLKTREYERFSERIRKGGDMYEDHISFIEWAKNYDTMEPPERCRKLHEEWFKKLSCPLLRVDGTRSIDELLKLIQERNCSPCEQEKK